MNLGLENFKGIKKGSLELGKFNVLLGSNNSAKTTILEAIYLMQNPSNFTMFGGYPLNVVGKLHNLYCYFGDNVALNLQWLFHNYIENEAQISLDDKIMTFIKDEVKIHICYYSPVMPGKKCKINDREFDGQEIAIFDINGNRLSQTDHSGLNFPIKGEPLFFSYALMPHFFNLIQRNWIELANKEITGKVAEEMSKLSPESYIDFTNEPFFGQQNTLFVYTGKEEDKSKRPGRRNGRICGNQTFI